MKFGIQNVELDSPLQFCFSRVAIYLGIVIVQGPRIGRTLASGTYSSPELAHYYCLHMYFLFLVPVFSSHSLFWFFELATCWPLGTRRKNNSIGSSLRASNWNRL